MRGRYVIWTIMIIMILSLTSICICIGLSSNKIRNNNLRKEQENSLHFFNMILPSSTEGVSELVLSCPDWPLETSNSDRDWGSQPPQTSKIEILGAYFDVFDPWGQCSPEPIDIISQTCDQDGANNQGLCSNLVKHVEENGVSAQWYRNTICGTKYKNGSGYGGKVNNKIDNNTESYSELEYVCRLQDATPFLVPKCNGEKECRIDLGNSNEVSQNFGSVPCYNSMSGVELKKDDDAYWKLPSDQKRSNDTKFQQGYVVKGVYRCVPE